MMVWRPCVQGVFFCGGASIAMFYAYLIGFDLLNSIGHCNFEFIPQWFMNIPVGPGGYCPPCHPTHVHPSSLEYDGTP